MENYLTDLLGLPNVVVELSSGIEASICLHIKFTNTGINCPHCHSYTQEIHQKRSSLVRDLSAFGNCIYLKVPRRQFYCGQCRRYLTEKLEWIDNQRRHTNRYESNIYERVLSSGIKKVAESESL